MGFCTVARIVKSVCEAIWQCMVSTYMPVPGAEDWRKIAGDYEKLADFPNCLGAIDGKHVVIQAPPSTGSQYFNYKGEKFTLEQTSGGTGGSTVGYRAII